MPCVYIGLDPTAGRRPINYAILDDDLRLLECGLGKLAQVLEVIAAHPVAMVAIDAPQTPNAQLLIQPEYRARLGLPLNTATWANFRVGEYELRRRGLSLYNTPGENETAPKWVQLGYELYAALKAQGFTAYQPGQSVEKQFLEVHPHACYAALLGHLPYRKDTLEGRLQRQLVLNREGVDVADGMEAVEEITRHHLLAGTLSLPGLRTHDELDAIVSAYTAYMVVTQPDLTTAVGDPVEGQIILPVPAESFKEIYR